MNSSLELLGPCLSDADCEDDDPYRGDIRRLLAATTRLLRRGQSASRRHASPVDPARLSRHLLVRHEQCHVQPHRLLLDERQVRPRLQLTFDTIIVDRPSNAVGPLREYLHDNLLTYLLNLRTK